MGLSHICPCSWSKSSCHSPAYATGCQHGPGDEKVHSHAQTKQLGLMLEPIWLPSGHAYTLIMLSRLQEHMHTYWRRCTCRHLHLYATIFFCYNSNSMTVRRTVCTRVSNNVQTMLPWRKTSQICDSIHHARILLCFIYWTYSLQCVQRGWPSCTLSPHPLLCYPSAPFIFFFYKCLLY